MNVKVDLRTLHIECLTLTLTLTVTPIGWT